jgi:hypothetical protein
LNPAIQLLLVFPFFAVNVDNVCLVILIGAQTAALRLEIKEQRHVFNERMEPQSIKWRALVALPKKC